MNTHELTPSLALLTRVLADPRLEPAQRERLRKGRCELEKLGKSGKPDRAKVFRTTFLITSTLVEALSGTQAEPSHKNRTTARRAR